MHEMSVAIGIVDIATNACRKANKSSVSKIALEIGGLAGVQLDALDFVWPVAIEGTVLEKAERIIYKIQAEAICLECSERFSVDNFYDNCPQCGSYFKNVTKGKELRVKYLEV